MRNAIHAMLVFAACLAWGPPTAAQMVYWADGTDNAIRRATFNGDNVETLISTGLDRPDGIAIDPVARKMYWAEKGGRIQRADLDGSNIELLVNAGGTPRDVALDLPRQKLYWIELAGQRIRRADLDGANVETVSDQAGGTAVAIDSAGGKVYWVRASVSRMNLDGSSPELFLPDNGFPREIDLDPENGWLYWVNSQFQFIGRATLPGGVAENLVTVVPGVPGDVAIDPTGGQMFWTDWTFGTIMRSDIGGDNMVAIISEGITEPLGIAIGPSPDTSVAVPTVSQWGLAMMACMLLVAGTVVLRRCDVGSHRFNHQPCPGGLLYRHR